MTADRRTGMFQEIKPGIEEQTGRCLEKMKKTGLRREMVQVGQINLTVDRRNLKNRKQEIVPTLNVTLRKGNEEKNIETREKGPIEGIDVTEEIGGGEIMRITRQEITGTMMEDHIVSVYIDLLYSQCVLSKSVLFTVLETKCKFFVIKNSFLDHN